MGVKLRFHEHINPVLDLTIFINTNILQTTVFRSAEIMVAIWVYLHDTNRLESLEKRWTKKIHVM